jgi:glycopeptide antibiotics resistance protein
MIATILLGTEVSLVIEILQAFLSKRESGTTDIITNTFGTSISAASYKVPGPMLARLFARWPIFVEPPR